MFFIDTEDRVFFVTVMENEKGWGWEGGVGWNEKGIWEVFQHFQIRNICQI